MTILTISPYQKPPYTHATNTGRLFRSLGDAEAYVAGRDAYWAVFASIPTDQVGNWQVPFPMSRQQYEDWAERVGVDAWADTVIRQNAYACQYYEPQTLTRETGLQTLRLRLANRRLAQLEWDDRQRPVVLPMEVLQTCAACGTTHPPRMLLTSPVGVVCPDCYDEVEG
jgi:hypothetical protein